MARLPVATERLLQLRAVLIALRLGRIPLGAVVDVSPILYDQATGSLCVRCLVRQ